MNRSGPCRHKGRADRGTIVTEASVLKAMKASICVAVTALALSLSVVAPSCAEQDEASRLNKESKELYLAALYANQHRYDQAEVLFKRGLAVLEKAHGPNDPEATVLMNNLADVYINRHRYADAERLLKRSIVVTEKAFGPDHPDIAQALNNLAALYARQGRNADAERLFKRSAVTFEKTLGPNHPDLADVLENLAGLYKDQGRYAAANA